MRNLQRILIAVGIVALVSCNRTDAPVSPLHPDDGAHAAAAPGIPLEAHVQFGIDAHGSPFPPPDEHDASGHARDHVYPREVVIARGGRVVFDIPGFHQAAVYEPGTEPEDIRVDQTTLEDVNFGPFTIPDFRINDPTNRIVLGPAQKLFAQQWTTPAGTFAEPGRYLVICTTTPHFVFAKMWAWVTVK